MHRKTTEHTHQGLRVVDRAAVQPRRAAGHPHPQRTCHSRYRQLTARSCSAAEWRARRHRDPQEPEHVENVDDSDVAVCLFLLRRHHAADDVRLHRTSRFPTWRRSYHRRTGMASFSSLGIGVIFTILECGRPTVLRLFPVYQMHLNQATKLIQCCIYLRENNTR